MWAFTETASFITMIFFLNYRTTFNLMLVLLVFKVCGTFILQLLYVGNMKVSSKTSPQNQLNIYYNNSGLFEYFWQLFLYWFAYKALCSVVAFYFLFLWSRSRSRSASPRHRKRRSSRYTIDCGFIYSLLQQIIIKLFITIVKVIKLQFQLIFLFIVIKKQIKVSIKIEVSFYPYRGGQTGKTSVTTTRTIYCVSDVCLSVGMCVCLLICARLNVRFAWVIYTSVNFHAVNIMCLVNLDLSRLRKIIVLEKLMWVISYSRRWAGRGQGWVLQNKAYKTLSREEKYDLKVKSTK